MDVEFRLAVYDEEDEENKLLLEDYLRLRQAGTVDWDPSLENSGLSLVCQGREWLLDHWNTGQINLLILQVEEAVRRLKEGRETIVRIGAIDSAGGPYLLLTPTDREVEISLFVIRDRRYYLDFPIEDVSGSAADLYAHLDQQRQELLEPVGGAAGEKYFKRLRCPGQELLAEMQRAAQSGRDLYELLGRPVDSEVYS
ncbi:MAG TPA: hypothetical protein VLC52_14250 [Anaerolineae bacterium]|nr:hypothetical protein [Anaerolineae bacterium]